MHAFARPRQHIFSRPHLDRCGRGLRHGRLQGPDGPFERQSIILQDLRGDAAAITHNGGQNDSAVDVPAFASFCGCRGGFQDAHQIGRDVDDPGVDRRGAALLHDVADDVVLKPAGVNLAGGQHVDGVRIFAQRSQHVLERNLLRSHGACALGCARQGRRQNLRYRYMAEIGNRQSRHVPLPQCRRTNAAIRPPRRTVAQHCQGRETCQTCAAILLGRHRRPAFGPRRYLTRDCAENPLRCLREPI